MKKILFFLLAGGSALFMASCTKQYNQVTPNETVYADLKPSDWGTANGGLTDTAVINTPQIDKYFSNHGGVMVYFTFDGGQTYEQIPEVYNNVSFTYIYTDGGIELYAQSANGAQVITPPAELTAKIVLVPSN
ncbi:MAG: hypothetical protein ACTHNW_01380 [Mucilaginibacter sp.]